MAVPSFVQSNTADQTSTATPQITLTGVTAGNLLVLVAHNYGADRGLIGVTDDDSNSWSVPVESLYGANGDISIGYAVAGASGDVTVTWEWGASTNTFLTIIEASGQDATPADASDSEENAFGGTHYCANAGNIDTSTDVLIVACGLAGANPGTITIPADFTGITTSIDSGQGWVGYRTSASALTDYRAEWSVSTSRVTVAGIMSFKGAAGGGATVPIFDHHYRSLRSA